MDEQTYILLNAILIWSQLDGFTGSNREPDNELYALCNELPCLSWDFLQPSNIMLASKLPLVFTGNGDVSSCSTFGCVVAHGNNGCIL